MVCEFAMKKDGEILCRCLNLAHGTINGAPINVQSNKCKENPNCYYKQLKRLEQEKNKYYQQTLDDEITISDLIEEIQELKADRTLERISKLSIENARLEQENKELNFKINQLKANGLYNDLTDIGLSAKVVELKQENKELKEEIQFHNKENSNLLAERNAAQIGYDEIREVRERYRSALEEIKTVLKFYADTWVDEKIYPNLHYDNTKAKEGLSRINEVLNDN